jgi:microcystin-dependent protein
MAEPFLGQICIYGFNFAPTGWAQCQGQTLAISQYTALFSLLGTNFGGNGTSTFQLPNFQSNSGVSQGQGPGLSSYVVGETSGSANETLTYNQMPLHNHPFIASTTPGSTTVSANNQLAKASTGGKKGTVTANYLNTTTPNTPLNSLSLSIVGGNAPHMNMQPYLALNYCIALRGVFPSRN